MLTEPLTRDAAVQLALAISPSIQALIARRWEAGATAAQSGRIPNPVFSFERLVSGDNATTDVERFIDCFSESSLPRQALYCWQDLRDFRRKCRNTWVADSVRPS